MALLKRFLGQDQARIERKPVIDIEALLQEIAPDAPSGKEDPEYDPHFRELEKKIEGTPEKRVGEQVIEERKDPVWPEIEKIALELLDRTHDLRVAVSLVRALIHTNGIPGLRDGLALIDGMLERFWETLYPQLDPVDNNDPTQRVNILMTFCDRETVLLPLSKAPLCPSPNLGKLSLRDIQIATGKLTATEDENKTPVTLETIQAAFQDCPAEELQEISTAVGETLELGKNIENLLNEKIGAQESPHFADLYQLLEEMNAVFKKHQGSASPPTKEPATVSNDKQATAQTTSSPGGSPLSGAMPMDTINSRTDVISLLEQICLYYEKNEPASPIPLLLKRAIGLVEKDFMGIIQDLAPDGLPQVTMISGKSQDEEQGG